MCLYSICENIQKKYELQTHNKQAYLTFIIGLLYERRGGGGGIAKMYCHNVISKMYCSHGRLVFCLSYFRDQMPNISDNDGILYKKKTII